MHRVPTLAAWIAACALAEGIGMGAAAAASRAATEVSSLGAALGIIVLGGLVEGSALGALQGWWLARRFPGLSRMSWLAVTIVVAGLGWAAASLPGLGASSAGGGAARKTWWRNLRQPAALMVWADSNWLSAEGVVLAPADDRYAAAAELYRRRWPRIRVPAGSPLVRVDLAPAA